MANVAEINAILEANQNLQNDIQTLNFSTVQSQLSACPTNTSLWSNLPLLSSPTGCLCVIDSDVTRLRCGVCCQWTVPGGATVAQFQLWGPGGGSGSGCCCGGSPFGATGAYATIIIPVTAGWTYTLCAGCACCCYAARAQNSGYKSCPSFVTGCGLCNICAEGACVGMYRQMAILKGTGTTCRYQNPQCTDSGACMCNAGTDYCFTNSCATCGLVPYTPDPAATYYGCHTNGTRALGLPSVWPEGCFDTNHYGYFRTPPAIGVCHTAQSGTPCCASWTSSSCGGAQCGACQGSFRYPGMGGTMTHAMGGCITLCGDAGRAGMVRVTWK